MQKVILASESPRRRELLSSLGINYTTSSSGIEEVFDTSIPLEEALKRVAYQKAEAVAKQYPNDVVLGADTIVVVDDQILGKPENDDEARKMLRMLSGREHRVLTGTAILYQNESETYVEETKVTFYELEEEMIDWYIATKEPKDKAGAYGIQGKGSILVKRIEGDYYNVVGLPLASTYRYLQKYIMK